MTTTTIVSEQVNTLVIQSSNETGYVVTENNNTVIVDNQSTYTIVAGTIGPSSNSIGTMMDVDLTNLVDGSTLIYDNNTYKWTSTTLLDKQIIESGHY